MRVVADTNRIIAAMIRQGASRRILFNDKFEFLSPESLIVEINEYEEEISGKALIDRRQFAFLLSLMLERIEIMAISEYEAFLDESKSLVSDLDDVPFIALALATKAEGI